MRSNIPSDKKAAIILDSLDGKISDETLENIKRNLISSERDRVSSWTKEVRSISPDERESVMDEFSTLYRSFRMGNLVTSSGVLPFEEFSKKVEPRRLYEGLKDERAQTIALVLSSISSDKAAEVLSMFDPGKRNEISKRIASMSAMEREEATFKELEKWLTENIPSEVQTTKEGIDSFLEILNRLPREDAEEVMDYINKTDEELGEEIEDKRLTFNDLALLSDIEIDQVIRFVDRNDLGMALKGKVPGDEVYDRLASALPPPTWDRIKESIPHTPQPKRQVEEARKRVLNRVKVLEREGQITIQRTHEEMVG